MSLDPYHCYYLYNAMRLHFTSDYDANKYKFKTSANPKSYYKRRDKYFFGKLARRFDDTKSLLDYYVAHFAKGNNWVGDMITNEDTYKNWQRISQSLGYTFKSDLEKFQFDVEAFDEIVKYSEPYPLVIQKYLGGEICLETLVILNKLTKFVSRVDKEINDTIVWPDVKDLIYNYDPFLEVDLGVTKKIILDTFTQ